MPAVRGITIIAACGVACAAVGGTVGWSLGISAPEYYRGVFRAAGDPGFSPSQVGFGLGISQGLMVGAVIGTIIVLASGLSRPKNETADDPAPRAAPDVPRSRNTRRFLIGVCFLIATASAGTIGFVAGGVMGQRQIYRQRTDAMLARIRPVLREPRFEGVHAEFSSAAQVDLVGTVGSDEARKALEDRLRSLFGDEEARSMIVNVEVLR